MICFIVGNIKKNIILPFRAYLIEVDCLIVVSKVETDLSVVGLESVEV